MKTYLLQFSTILLLTTGLSVNASTNHNIYDRSSYNEEVNRAIVTTFYQELFGDHDLTSIDRYIDPHTCIQHNPTLPNGAEPLRAAAEQWFEGLPPTIVDIRRSVAERDLVWLHVKNNQTKQEIVEIFRLANGKIVEHWDVIQEIPIESSNLADSIRVHFKIMSLAMLYFLAGIIRNEFSTTT